MERFGSWTVIEPILPREKHARSLCRCDCGTVRVVGNEGMERGSSTSCGCSRRVNSMRGSKEHRAWSRMKYRCLNSRFHQFRDYGGRGISVCPEWVESFDAFYAHVGPVPSAEHTLDRIDNDGDYEPGNVRWATRSEQMRNTRRNVLVIMDGETRCITDWALSLGIKHDAFRRRMDMWPKENWLDPRGTRHSL